jgi:hypothetical protein
LSITTSAIAAATSVLSTALYGSGVGERQIGKLTATMLNKLLFAQGWQFAVEVDGLSGADFFVKDITYCRYSIEYEPLQIGGGIINQPVRRTIEPFTMMIRDTVDGQIQQWFDAAQDAVINQDGTVNLASDYIFNIRIYKLLSAGITELETEMQVFPVQRGEVTRSRDQVTEFLTVPLTFARYSTFTDPAGASASLSLSSFGLSL